MGSPIDHTQLEAGDVVTAAGLNTNFDKVNAFLIAKVADTYIANPKHNLIWTWHMDEIAVGTEQIAIKIPATLTGGGTFLELSAFTSDIGAGGSLVVNLHTSAAYPPTSATKLVGTALTADSDGDFASTTSFTTATFTANSTFYIQYVVIGNAVTGATISLYGSANNRST